MIRCPVRVPGECVCDERASFLEDPGPSSATSVDALGRRGERIVNGVTTGYLYDGTQAIAELKGGAVNAVLHTGLVLDEVLARYGSSGNKSLLTDALQSVIAQADDSQTTQNFYAYSTYGQASTLGLDGGNPLQYTGRENDGTGLYFYRARYYDPVLKRFIQEDPVGIDGGLNLYAYAQGSPLRFSDPLGLSFWDSIRTFSPAKRLKREHRLHNRAFAVALRLRPLPR